MRQFNKFRNTQGFLIALDRGIRFRYMITETAQKRAKVLTFWHHHGLEATREAFNVSRPTLYRWARALAQSKGKLEALNSGSQAPKNKRKRVIPLPVLGFIITERTTHPRLGKEKVAIALREAGHTLSDSTVGRMIGDLKKRGLLPKYTKLSFYARTGRLSERIIKPAKKIRRPKQYTEPCLEVDTIVRFVDGIKRYILTAVDVERKFTFAYGYTSHSSSTATDFLDKVRTVAPFSIKALQTDNGSEFANHFHEACLRLNIIHFHTYPRCPKLNPCIERFNRTLSEEFLIWNRTVMRDDLRAFNRKLMDYLIWYNTRRPHWSLGLLSPLQYICSQLPAVESQMIWTDT